MQRNERWLCLHRLAVVFVGALAFVLIAGCAPKYPGTPDEQVVDDRVSYMRWNLDPGSNSLYYWTSPDVMDRAQANTLFNSATGYFEEGNYLAATELFDHVGQACYNRNGTSRWPRDKQYALTSYYYAWSFDVLCDQDPEYCAAFVRVKGEQNVQAAIDARVLTSYLAALEAPLPSDMIRHAVKSCVEAQKDLAISMKAPPRLGATTQARYQSFIKARCE